MSEESAYRLRKVEMSTDGKDWFPLFLDDGDRSVFHQFAGMETGEDGRIDTDTITVMKDFSIVFHKDPRHDNIIHRRFDTERSSYPAWFRLRRSNNEVPPSESTLVFETRIDQAYRGEKWFFHGKVLNVKNLVPK